MKARKILLSGLVLLGIGQAAEIKLVAEKKIDENLLNCIKYVVENKKIIKNSYKNFLKDYNLSNMSLNYEESLNLCIKQAVKNEKLKSDIKKFNNDKYVELKKSFDNAKRVEDKVKEMFEKIKK